MKIILAPGTFKGTLTAAEAADAMSLGVLCARPSAEIVLMPVGDGGEGTAAALSRTLPGSLMHTISVTGPLGLPVEANFFTLAPDHRTAALDMASAAGLLLTPESSRDPMRATTFGVGELIAAAIAHPGVDRVVIGLGGSATNDCGAACLQALGFRLRSAHGTAIDAPAFPADLARVVSIDPPAESGALLSTEVVIACDVDNPLVGPRGASRVFGPQKGADQAMVDRLDELLAGFGRSLDRYACDRFGKPVSDRPGAGAAGGLGAALVAAFPQAAVSPGIDVVLDVSGFGDALVGAGLVLTGEGRLDSQTLGGKAIAGVLRRAAEHQVPVIAIAGSADPEAVAALMVRGLSGVYELVQIAGSLTNALTDPAKYVREAARRAVD